METNTNTDTFPRYKVLVETGNTPHTYVLVDYKFGSRIMTFAKYGEANLAKNKLPQERIPLAEVKSAPISI